MREDPYVRLPPLLIRGVGCTGHSNPSCRQEVVDKSAHGRERIKEIREGKGVRIGENGRQGRAVEARGPAGEWVAENVR